MRRDRGAELDRSVPPDRVRNVEHGDLPDLGRKVVGGIFGVDAHLDRVAGEGHRVLRDAERERRRGSYLELDKVQAGDRFGDRVFDLEPGVHLEEEVVAGLVVDDELDGPRRVVADRLGESKRSGAQPGLGRIGRFGAGASSTSFW